MTDSAITTSSTPPVGDEHSTGNGNGNPENVPTPSENQAVQKQAKKRNANRRTPDLNAVLKTLLSCGDDAQRIETLKNSYDALYRKYDSFREKHANCRDTEMERAALKKECDALRSDLAKVLQIKQRLETLCRELQKTNHEVREEALASSKRDEERRLEVSERFTATITEVQARSTDIVKRNSELEEQRVEYAAKLDGLIADYGKIQADITEKETRWRAHEEALVKQLECERALSAQEKHVLLTQLEVEKHKLNILESREGELQTQLKTYATRYEEIEGSLRQSAETVAVFRAEISKASKAIQSVQRENEALKKANMQLALDKLELERQKQIVDVKVTRLESLCRAMQKVKLGDGSSKPDDEPKKADADAASPECASGEASGQVQQGSESEAAAKSTD